MQRIEKQCEIETIQETQASKIGGVLLPPSLFLKYDGNLCQFCIVSRVFPIVS